MTWNGPASIFNWSGNIMKQEVSIYLGITTPFPLQLN
jgi:hypothetical protein